MRNASQEQAAFNWITPKTFGERIGGEKPVSAAHVRRLIARGLVRKDMVCVLNPGSARKDYRINPAAVGVYQREFSIMGLEQAA